MSDDRTKREKLEAMANQTASPREAEVAKRKLAEHDKTHPLFRRRDPVNGREVQGKQCTTRNAMGHRCEGYPNHRGNHIYVNRG